MIKKIYYNKLVRDKIPEIIEARGSRAKFKKLNSKEFFSALLTKVNEESSALPVVKTKKELVSELADVMAVIEEIKKIKKISDKELKIEMDANMARKGGFNKKLFLVWSEDDKYKTNEKRNTKKS